MEDGFLTHRSKHKKFIIANQKFHTDAGAQHGNKDKSHCGYLKQTFLIFTICCLLKLGSKHVKQKIEMCQ
jgi:hypothetical protein